MASTDCQREGQATVEFGAKFDLSPNNEGYGRIEKISFAAYNESGCLIEAIERFKERTGYYQERVLADQIYWTRENRSYCKEQGIRLSGPKLGRPNATAQAEKNKSTRIISIESKWSALLVEQTLLWYELHYHKTGRNAVDFYRMICIRDESVQNPEANTLCFFAFVPILV